MIKYYQDTIAAISTPPGNGGVGIIRISGKDLENIANQVANNLPKPRSASLQKFKDSSGEYIDQGILLFFPGPNSFTGEDVLEFHGHGGAVLLSTLLEAILAAGARIAEPGEFSKRAFLNDKIDLTQAEAISSLIYANSKSAIKAAYNSLQGVFADKVNNILEKLVNLRMHVESAIDFPEEEIDFLSDNIINEKHQVLIELLESTVFQAEQGALLNEEFKVVIVGEPNAGKSSLLNVLAGRNEAIVTDIPGTTRDVISKIINIRGVNISFSDTAGIRETSNPVEEEGIRRAYLEIKKANLIILLREAGANNVIIELPKDLDTECLTVVNKVDLGLEEQKSLFGEIKISCKTGEGVNVLIDEILKYLGHCGSSAQTPLMARTWQVCSLKQVLSLVKGAVLNLQVGAGELVAEQLKQAQETLGEITGKFSNDDLLGKIFSEFCIGK